ncbi:hypothetical protein [Labrys sp. (in: a-proteobacteria)]|uniref:hypothetical protein n=1 Tax=Labrys sp. (in: a-proteobacteria) TaxID=1917972 RepID=UPI0039E24901
MPVKYEKTLTGMACDAFFAFSKQLVRKSKRYAGILIPGLPFPRSTNSVRTMRVASAVMPRANNDGCRPSENIMASSHAMPARRVS